jgi:hypothetical protein
VKTKLFITDVSVVRSVFKLPETSSRKSLWKLLIWEENEILPGVGITLCIDRVVGISGWAIVCGIVIMRMGRMINSPIVS